jgi:monovalent cation/hydrogen antiporter
MGIRGPSIIPARVRLQGFFTWDIVDFIINSALFVLVGLQLRTIVESLSDYSMATLLGGGHAIAGVTVVTRIIWFFTVPYLVRGLDRRPSQRERRIPARNRFLLGWIGMRGAVSLAAALSIPLTIDGGAPFPNRDLILFLTFAVIFVTLVVQGLSLPAVIRRLHISDDGASETEELKARLGATKAALAQIDELAKGRRGRARSRTTATRIARSSASRRSRSCSGPSATRWWSSGAKGRSRTRR